MDIDRVNFIPESYYRKAAACRRRLGRAVLLGLAVATLCVTAGVQFVLSADARRDVWNLEGQARRVDEADHRLELKQARQRELERELATRQELHQPITASHTLVAIANLLDPAASLTRLEVIAVRPQPAPKPKPGDKKAAAKAEAQAEQAKDKPQQPYELHVNLEGLAPNEHDVASLVESLTQSPMFSHVRLEASRPGRLGPYQTREFELSLTIPLHRHVSIVQAAPLDDRDDHRSANPTANRDPNPAQARASVGDADPIGGAR